jgi:hypothetical protein
MKRGRLACSGAGIPSHATAGSGQALPAPESTSASGWICLSCCDVMTCFVRERDAPATAGETPALQAHHLVAWICLSSCGFKTCFVRERDAPATAGIPSPATAGSGQALPAPESTSASVWICLSCCDVKTCFVRERDAPATAGETPALQAHHLMAGTVNLDLRIDARTRFVEAPTPLARRLVIEGRRETWHESGSGSMG